MVLTSIAVAGCGGGGGDGDDALEAKLADLKQRGEAARLSDLTDFSWDEVHLFNEYTRREAIEKIVGSPVITADYHNAGSLLVFEDHGKVVKSVTVSGDYLRAERLHLRTRGDGRTVGQRRDAADTAGRTVPELSHLGESNS